MTANVGSELGSEPSLHALVLRLRDTVIWLQTQIWFVGKRTPTWSSLRQIRFRMVVCLPTVNHAGTALPRIRPVD